MHLAVIMDGNGRWATKRGASRIEGHRHGMNTVRMVIREAAAHGVSVLSLYAFSSDNWRRPESEVSGLFLLFRRFLAQELENLIAEGIRLRFIGRRDRLPASLLAEMEMAEQRTQSLSQLEVRIAVDYSSRQELRNALPSNMEALGPDVDLLIRTGGEQRLSDFLLWQCAYAELFFTPVAWPDFSAADLADAFLSFRKRQRRFGAVPEAAIGCKIVVNDPSPISL